MLWILLVLIALCSFTNAQVTYGSSATKTGHVTFYGAGSDSGGKCSYNNPKASIASSLPTVAIGSFGNAEKCGTCVLITPKGTGSGNSDFKTRAPFIAYVNNECPECEQTNLDLAQSSDGVWDATWYFVDCPVTGNIELQLKTGSSIYWTEISARNFKVAIKSFEFQIGSSWVPLERKPYNFFVYTTQISLPVNARLTSVLGEQKTFTISSYANIEPAIITTNIQFTGSGSNPGTPPVAPVKAPVAPVKAPVAPVKAPVAPTKAPVAPTKAPVAPTKAPVSSTTTKCTYVVSDNVWWVEYNCDKSTISAAYVACADGQEYKCEKASWGTYQCNINKGVECKAPRKAKIDGACSPLDAGSCGSAIVEETDSAYQNINLPTGAIIGIVVAIVVVIVLLVVLIAQKLRTPPMEHV